MREVGQEHLIGRTIAGKFVVEELLGAGAMGAVFRARQVALEKMIAIKVLHGQHASDATFAARFQREARAASRLNHPNSLQVIDYGVEPDGLLYIAMEYLEGQTLHRLLHDEWPLPAARIADIVMQTLAALAVAHDSGIVHRDLKPENVMVLPSTDDDGRPKDWVKVCDFGIAKITDPRAYKGSEERESAAPVTTAGFLVGTPEYMSPEQGRGEKLSPQSDLYSVGVILFEMLTGRLPFEAENAIGVVLKHIAEEPPRPSQQALGVDPRLEAICLRALRKRPEERHRSARDMRAELRAVSEDRGSTDSTGRAAIQRGPLLDGPATAPTAMLEGAASAVRAEELPAPKSTPLGMASTVPGAPKRRIVIVAATALVTGVLMAATTLLTMRPRARSPATPPTPATVAAAPEVPIAVLETSPPRVEIAPSTPVAPPTAVSRTTVQSEGRPHPLPTAKAASSSGTSIAPSAVASSPGLQPASNAVAAASVVNPSPDQALPPFAAPAVAPAMQTPDTNFDPDKGYIEVGLVNAQGAREGFVRAALRGAGLVHCYRSALRAQGARVTGFATLNLSFDESGVTRAAIVTGANFLPGLARCLQDAGTAVHIARVDPSGGTAEVFLAFKIP